MNEILEATARRDYTFSFDERFQMHLFYANGKPVPRSGGENQLMSLAFISALVKFSQARAGRSDGSILIPGTVAPLVLDSPFGQLDRKYRIDTAKFVPELAEQVVLLVSTSQGDAEVLEAIKDRVGAEYVLISENRAVKGSKPIDKIVVRGREICQSLYGCPRDLTRIEKIL